MRTTHTFHNGRWLLIALAAMIVAIASGCGGGGGGSTSLGDTTAPSVQVMSYTRLLSATGGTATIDTVVTDNTGISKVEVRVTTPGGQVSTLTASPKGGVYSASYQASANSGTTAMVYKFTVYASDNAGNTGSDGEYSFQVPSAENPPQPPPFSIQ